LERIQAGLDYEQQLRQAKREKEMRIHRETVMENEENNRQKMLQKQKEQEEEFKRNQEYEERLRLEEQARQNAFKKRMEKIEKNSQLLNSMEATLTLEEQRHQEQHQQQEGQRGRAGGGGGAGESEGKGQFSWDDGSDVKKTLLKKEKLQKIKSENDRITLFKLQEQEEAKRRDHEDGLKLKLETMEFYEMERKRRQSELEKKKRYGMSLKHQIVENEELIMKSAMTKPEKSVNKNELNLIQNNPNLHSRIAHRLRMKTAPGTAREKLNTLALTRYTLSLALSFHLFSHLHSRLLFSY
jgi:hypothetical protein